MSSFTIGLCVVLAVLATIVIVLGWLTRSAKTYEPHIRTTRNHGRSCDRCAFQKGRNYCELHSLIIDNMESITCDNWSPNEVDEEDDWKGR